MANESKSISLPLSVVWGVILTVAGSLVTGLISVSLNTYTLAEHEKKILILRSDVEAIQATRYTAEEANERNKMILRELDYIRRELTEIKKNTK